jgi:acyl-CoA dehydrogenase
MEILLQHGTAEQRRQWLEPLLEGTIRSAFSMTEPEVAGSEPTGLRTRAVRDGDDYVITGHKWFTTGAVGAAFFIVMAVTDPEAPPHRRATLFIVPAGTPGLELVREIPVLGHAGKPGHSEIRYDGVRVPASAMLGEEGAGFVIAQDRLGPGRIHHCMRAIGHAERAIELMCARARTREVRGGLLADQQMAQDLIARSRIEAEQARLLVLYAAWRMDTVGKKAAAREISMAKVAAAQMAQEVVDRAIQLHGGLGVTDDTPLAGLARNARTLRLVDGADEVHKIVVARRELAAPAPGAGQ